MNRAESALAFISPVDREMWVQCGMALQSEFGDAARDIWTDWSRGADSFNETSARNVWKSFRGTGVTIASLFHEAKINGWRDEQAQKPTAEQSAALKRMAAERLSLEGKERDKSALASAEKARWILSQCKPERHAYLDSKGFRELDGMVWRPDAENNLLCVPMYSGSAVVGLQMIDRTGGKKFLSGQRTAEAEYRFDVSVLNAVDWWVEGYASGLSLRACLHALKLPYRIHVTFSAQNLKRMAHSGFVVADHDQSGVGEAAAIATGLPYWMPPETDTDINDVHQQSGTFRTSQMLGKWLREMRAEKDRLAG